MRTLVVILLLLLPLSLYCQEDLYKWGRPTSKGIDAYVERNWLVFIEDYQDFVNDTLFFEPFISTDDLSEYYHYTKGELGWFEYPDNIIITNEPRYIDYELSRLSDFQKERYRETNQFVRGVVMHELTHCYFYQVMMRVKQGDSLHYDFRQGLRIIPVDNFGTEFIEEGFCEFVTIDMKEMIGYDEKVVLIKNDLSPANRNRYEVKYRYATQFVRPIVEKYGLLHAMKLVVSHAAPSQEEILKPDLYYARLARIYIHE